MGCASSKRIEAAVDVYRPPPTSFAVFDINAIDEPWLKSGGPAEENHHPDKQFTYLPPPIMEKLNSMDDAPRTWDEVSKDLEGLKPAFINPKPPVRNSVPAVPVPVTLAKDSTAVPKAEAPRKSFSFHTLEELDAKLTPTPTDPTRTRSKKPDPVKPKVKELDNPRGVGSRAGFTPAADSEGYKPVRENIFVVRDRLEREKGGREAAALVKYDPLSEYPEKCPPGGSESVVLYTTSLGGVRRTYEDCNGVRSILESHRVVVDERDVALHGEYLSEMRELVGDGAPVPRVFVKGRYIGGAEEVVALNETGRLQRVLRCAAVERGVGRLGCGGCGGGRFVPCLECGGSCKVVAGDKKERCSHCNENGLVQCPACF